MYGPVRTVVWQGSAGNRRPYADLTGKAEVILNLALMAQSPHHGNDLFLIGQSGYRSAGVR